MMSIRVVLCVVLLFSLVTLTPTRLTRFFGVINRQRFASHVAGNLRQQ